jgi:hypothetical protein
MARRNFAFSTALPYARFIAKHTAGRAKVGECRLT